jgi:hypothetical protein
VNAWRASRRNRNQRGRAEQGRRAILRLGAEPPQRHADGEQEPSDQGEKRHVEAGARDLATPARVKSTRARGASRRAAAATATAVENERTSTTTTTSARARARPKSRASRCVRE